MFVREHPLSVTLRIVGEEAVEAYVANTDAIWIGTRRSPTTVSNSARAFATRRRLRPSRSIDPTINTSNRRCTASFSIVSNAAGDRDALAR